MPRAGYEGLAFRRTPSADATTAVDGGAAADSGHRWNPPGIRAVYLATDRDTTEVELLENGHDSGSAASTELHAVLVEVRGLIDLRDPAAWPALGLRDGCHPRTRCQEVGRAAHDAGAKGLIVRSAARPGAVTWCSSTATSTVTIDCGRSRSRADESQEDWPMSTIAGAQTAPATGDGAAPKPAELQSSMSARWLGALEEMGALESLGEWLDGVLTPLTSRRTAMDALHGRWLGHALHPALSDLPIGFWAAVPVLDAAGEDGGATVLTAAGCAAALATSLTGAADWSVSDGREKRLGLLHGLANAAGLALQVGSLVARARERRGAGRLLSLAGLGVSTAAAFIGGELVFGRGLMVDHTAWTAGPSEWTPVLDDAGLAEGDTRAVELAGRKVLLARVRGRVCAMEDACTHAGGPLSEGAVEDGVVQCPWHGSRFRLDDGSVAGGPATFPQLRLESRVVAGRIEVRGREG